MFSKEKLCAVFNGVLLACTILFATALYLQATKRMVINLGGISAVEFRPDPVAIETPATVMQPETGVRK